jgi:hypothetical protein
MPDAPSPRERRYPRAAARKSVLVAWRSGGRQRTARITTLGLGGLFINESDPPPVGSVLQLVFKTAAGDVRASVSVRNIEAGRGMGVEFLQMRQEERARLKQLIAGLLEQPPAPNPR